MRISVVVSFLLAALSVSAVGRADGSGVAALAAPRSLNAIGMSWASSSMWSAFPALMLVSLPDDEVSRGRRSYEFFASLPIPESTVRTYDMRPVVNAVFGRTLAISPVFQVTFVRGKHLLVADLGGTTQLGIAPTGFNLHGGVLSLSSAF